MFGQLGIVGGGGAGRSGFSPLGAALDIAFRDGVAVVNGIPRTIAGTTTSQNYPIVGSFSRPSAADWITVTGDGLETQAGNNVLRRGPVRGALFEQGVTAQPVNSLLAGFAAGSPGTLPTGAYVFTSLAGITRTLGEETINGIRYLTVRLNGTPSASGLYFIGLGPSVGSAASSGQVWTGSTFARLAAGTLAGVSGAFVAISERNSIGGELVTSTTPVTLSATAARFFATRTFSNASTANAHTFLRLDLTGAAIDLTISLGAWMLNQSELTSPILTTNSGTVTRAADIWTTPISIPADHTIVAVARAPSFLPPSGSSQEILRYRNVGTAGPRITRNDAGAILAGGTGTASVTLAAPSAGARFAVAYTNAAASTRASLNAGAVVAGTARADVTALDTLHVGAQNASGLTAYNDFIERVIVFPFAVNDATLQQYATLSTWGG